MEDFKRERSEMVQDLEKKVKVVTAHIDQKNLELRNLKFLSKSLLHQKSEVDTFFLDSIEFVKEQKAKQPISQNAKKNDQNNHLASIKGNINRNLLNDRQLGLFVMRMREPASKPQLDPSKKVDITDLDWEEKEKILRILYTKVNMGVSPGYWKHLSKVQKSKPIDQHYMNEEEAESSEK